jgi:hypothetical protein
MFNRVISAETRRLRVRPAPPTPAFGFAAAPEIAIAVASVMPRFPRCIHLSDRTQPVASLPQYSGDMRKLSPPRPLNFDFCEATRTTFVLMRL